MNITEWIKTKLKDAGLLSSFDNDDVLNASNEDSLRSYEKVVDKVRTVTKARVDANAKLWATLNDAKTKTKAFEALEHLIGRDRH